MSIKRFILRPSGRIRYPNSTAAFSILAVYAGAACFWQWIFGVLNPEPAVLLAAAVMAVLGAMMLYEIMLYCRQPGERTPKGVAEPQTGKLKPTLLKIYLAVVAIAVGSRFISDAIVQSVYHPSAPLSTTLGLLFIFSASISVIVGAVLAVAIILRAVSDYGRLFLTAMPGWVQRRVSVSEDRVDS